jgi:hypothetical protein
MPTSVATGQQSQKVKNYYQLVQRHEQMQRGGEILPKKLMGECLCGFSFTTSHGDRSIDYVDMPDTSVNLTLDKTSTVMIMFSTEATIGEAEQGIFIQAYIYQTQAVPSFVCLPTPTNGTFYNAHSYNFYEQSVNAGTHTVKILWKVTGGTGYVRNRTLIVMATPA